LDDAHKTEIMERLTKIETQLEYLAHHLTGIKKEIESLTQNIEKKDYDVRIDRLEQAQNQCDERRVFQMRIVFGVLGALVVKGVAVVGYLVSKGLPTQ